MDGTFAYVAVNSQDITSYLLYCLIQVVDGMEILASVPIDPRCDSHTLTNIFSVLLYAGIIEPAEDTLTMLHRTQHLYLQT